MHQAQVQLLDLRFVQLDVPKLIALLNKSFARKKNWVFLGQVNDKQSTTHTALLVQYGNFCSFIFGRGLQGDCFYCYFFESWGQFVLTSDMYGEFVNVDVDDVDDNWLKGRIFEFVYGDGSIYAEWFFSSYIVVIVGEYIIGISWVVFRVLTCFPLCESRSSLVLQTSCTI